MKATWIDYVWVILIGIVVFFLIWDTFREHKVTVIHRKHPADWKEGDPPLNSP